MVTENQSQVSDALVTLREKKVIDETQLEGKLKLLKAEAIKKIEPTGKYTLATDFIEYQNQI